MKTAVGRWGGIYLRNPQFGFNLELWMPPLWAERANRAGEFSLSASIHLLVLHLGVSFERHQTDCAVCQDFGRPLPDRTSDDR